MAARAKTKTDLFSFDSRSRDASRFPDANRVQVKLPYNVRNVRAVELESIEMINSPYVVPASSNTFVLYESISHQFGGAAGGLPATAEGASTELFLREGAPLMVRVDVYAAGFSSWPTTWRTGGADRLKSGFTGGTFGGSGIATLTVTVAGSAAANEGLCRTHVDAFTVDLVNTAGRATPAGWGPVTPGLDANIATLGRGFASQATGAYPADGATGSVLLGSLVVPVWRTADTTVFSASVATLSANGVSNLFATATATVVAPSRVRTVAIPEGFYTAATLSATLAPLLACPVAAAQALKPVYTAAVSSVDVRARLAFDTSVDPATSLPRYAPTQDSQWFATCFDGVPPLFDLQVRGNPAGTFRVRVGSTFVVEFSAAGTVAGTIASAMASIGASNFITFADASDGAVTHCLFAGVPMAREHPLPVVVNGADGSQATGFAVVQNRRQISLGARLHEVVGFEPGIAVSSARGVLLKSPNSVNLSGENYCYVCVPELAPGGISVATTRALGGTTLNDSVRAVAEPSNVLAKVVITAAGGGVVLAGAKDFVTARVEFSPPLSGLSHLTILMRSWDNTPLVTSGLGYSMVFRVTSDAAEGGGA